MVLHGMFSYRCPCHVPDMVLHGTSHLGANAMSQTWSYMGPLYPNVMTFVSDTFFMFQRGFLTPILCHLILELTLNKFIK
ncbi:hypothetical protein Gotur_033242 [Gossypium turneri]